MPDTQQRIRGVIEKIAERPLPSDPDESLFDAGLIDSWQLATLVSAIEEEFSIKVSDADLNPRKFESVTRIEAYLSSHSSSK